MHQRRNRNISTEQQQDRSAGQQRGIQLRRPNMADSKNEAASNASANSNSNDDDDYTWRERMEAFINYSAHKRCLRRTWRVRLLGKPDDDPEPCGPFFGQLPPKKKKSSTTTATAAADSNSSDGGHYTWRERMHAFINYSAHKRCMRRSFRVRLLGKPDDDPEPCGPFFGKLQPKSKSGSDAKAGRHESLSDMLRSVNEDFSRQAGQAEKQNVLQVGSASASSSSSSFSSSAPQDAHQTGQATNDAPAKRQWSFWSLIGLGGSGKA